jgi:hypothetical protein
MPPQLSPQSVPGYVHTKDWKNSFVLVLSWRPLKKLVIQVLAYPAIMEQMNEEITLQNQNDMRLISLKIIIMKSKNETHDDMQY